MTATLSMPPARTDPTARLAIDRLREPPVPLSASILERVKARHEERGGANPVMAWFISIAESLG